jgi:plasmid stabilization system protein ParE
MQGYRLSKEAQDDLTKIKSYSRMNWGDQQTKEYR